MKYAYITLFSTNDYLPGIIGLIVSWKRTNPKYPLYVMTTPTITEQNLSILKCLGVESIPIEEFIPAVYQQQYDEVSKIYEMELWGSKEKSGWIHTYSKLHLWKLIQFDKVCFLDGDTLILQNIDDIFQYDEFGAVHHNNAVGVNTAIFIAKPDMVIYNKLLDFANTQTIPGHLLSEAAILNAFFEKDLYKNNSWIDERYHWDHQFLNNKDLKPDEIMSLRAIHFGGPERPWTNGNEKVNALSKDWYTYKVFYQYYKDIINTGIRTVNTQLHLQLAEMPKGEINEKV